ncbi:flagellar protein [Rhizobium sp. Leaf384]|uniref:DUF1217 domain-containing protein n=1 Tax=unclassified Rhizobium TaxID=2613769 RepID=UPI0007155A78|nr:MULTISPECIES: DUF1217 domain-containing protein [unclassified Rhizobium]KQS77354.1 flagellar protein [Rhizobium sp. Leaf383]KQS80737.1 flagellar protein [Rhizobium sp. Leaf384]
MSSTYLDYNLIVRDMKESINRVSQQKVVERDTQYYKDNIGKVTTVDAFLSDYRLYAYAMKAHGLEDMTYAKAFMKKVLESDLNDDKSYANQLTDDRYRNFAMAFSFDKSATVAQTSAQEDAVIGLYNANIANADSAMNVEVNYFNAMTMDGNVKTVDQFLQNDRLRDYAFPLFGLNPDSYDFASVRQALTSDVNDPASYINTLQETASASLSGRGAEIQDTIAKYDARSNAAAQIATLTNSLSQPGADQTAIQAKIAEQEAIFNALDAQLPPMSQTATNVSLLSNEYAQLEYAGALATNLKAMATAFKFNPDGTAPASGPLVGDSDKASMRELYFASAPRLTGTGAVINKDYFEAHVNDFATATDLLADSRMRAFIITAYGIPRATASTVLKAIITSDLDDPTSYANTTGAEYNAAYKQLAAGFNFKPDGTLNAGEKPQTDAQKEAASANYMNRYNDVADAADEKLISSYKAVIGKVDKVDTLLANPQALQLALSAFGVENEGKTVRELRLILTSDVNDPKSYVNTLKDDRYVKLTNAFNFKTDGKIGAPKLAQSQSEILQISKAYVVAKSQFGTAKDKTDATAEAKYYASEMEKVGTLDDLLGNKRMTDFILVATGIDPKTVPKDYLKKVFTSDLADPKSLINTEADPRYRELVASFNFDKTGKTVRPQDNQIQTRRGLLETQDLYLNQTLEQQTGEDNEGVRLALYFRRMASGIGSVYDILADTPLMQVVRTTFSIPEEMSSADVDVQADYIKRVLDVKDLHDPEKLEKLMKRFTALYDLQNDTNTSPALAIFNSSAGSGGISGDSLLAIAQLRRGG